MWNQVTIFIRSMSLVFVVMVFCYQEMACLPRPAIANEIRVMLGQQLKAFPNKEGPFLMLQG